MSWRSETYLFEDYDDSEEFDEFDELEKFGKLLVIEEISLKEVVNTLDEFEEEEE